MIPRAQGFLLGAVWLIKWAILHTNADPVTATQDSIVETNGIDYTDYGKEEWSQQELSMLREVMEEHVRQFKLKLVEYEFTEEFAPRSRRTERATLFRSPTILEASRFGSHKLKVTTNQLASQTDTSCFVWNGEFFCILGDTIFLFKDAKVEPFPITLPVGKDDYVKAHVYDDAIFLAIYNKITPSLKLYLIRNRDAKTPIEVQHITGEALEDCSFFENEGTLYMVLAIQLGSMQYSKNFGMHCVIYEWLGTTMDMKYMFPAPHLLKIRVLPSPDAVHLALLHNDSSVHLHKFTENEETELLDITEVNIAPIVQFDAFMVESNWCVLLAGATTTHVYCLNGDRMLQWQVLKHNFTNNSGSWIWLQQLDSRSAYDSTILIFNAFDSQSNFEVYLSDPSGHFTLVFVSSNLQFTGIPLVSLAFLNSPILGRIYVAVNHENESFLEGFTVHMLDELHDDTEKDPLIECLSEVDHLISNFDTTTFAQAEQLKNNLVHFKDDFTTSGTLIVNQMSYSNPIDYGKVMVMYNFSEEFEKPGEINIAVENLEVNARKLESELPTLLYTTNSSFTGRLTFQGKVASNEVNVPSASVSYVNERMWDNFVSQTWRYSSEHSVNGNINIGKLKVKDITVGSTVGGSLPSNWLLKTGGEITGKTTFTSLDVHGSIDVGNHFINGVAMADVLLKNSSLLEVQGSKTFRAIEVINNATADSINERDFGAWAQNLVLQRSKEKQNFTGVVHLKGPVLVTGDLQSDWINGINVTRLPEILVDKNSHQVINGSVHFASPLLVVDAQVDSLNGILIGDLLSTSGEQTIRATIEVDILDVRGDLDCSDINGENVSNFVYIDERELQVISSPILFKNDLIIDDLTMERGTLNNLDIIDLLNPKTLRIDSQIQANGDLTAHAAHVKVINGIELSNIRRDYWTKTTDQSIGVKVRIPSEVVIKGNVTTGTFMGHSTDRGFYKTTANESFNDEVAFGDDVTMIDLVVKDLNEINGVTLQALDEDVVKKDGDFQIVGTKTFEQLTIFGDLAIEETLNNLNIPEDIALLNRSQTITGAYFGSDIVVDNDVIVSRGDITLNMVAGFLLDDFVLEAVMIDEDAVIHDNLRFERHLDVNDLVIQNNLNDRDVNEVVKNGLRKSNEDVLRLSKLAVHGQVTFKDAVNTSTINDYNIHEYLGQTVNMTNPKLITGIKKTFLPTFVEQTATFKMFNGVPLDFDNMLSKSSNQTITGEYVLNNLTSESIDLRAINGRNLSDFVQTAGTNEVQVITGEVDIEEMNVRGSLKIEDQTLNGCILPEYIDITKFTHFESLSVVNGTLLLEQPFQNNADLATISLRALRKDRPQSVTGNVTFLSEVQMNNLNISGNRLGAVDLNELLHGTMLKSKEQNVTGKINYLDKIQIANAEQVGHLKVNKWNGEDVQSMVDQVILKTGNQTVRAKKTFLGDLNVMGNLVVNGNIGSVPVSSLVKTSENRLPNQTKFTSLMVKEHLNVTSGIIDGVNITSLLHQRVPLTGNSTIKGNIIFQNSITADNIIAKTINNVNMSDLVWKTTAPGQVITGKKILQGSLNVQGDLIVDLLNGRNPEEASAFVVLKDQDAEFEQPLIFLGDLTVAQHVNITTYNGQNMNQLITKATSAEFLAPEARSQSIQRTLPFSVLLSLQKSTQLTSNFEFFEQIQQVSFNFPHGSNMSLEIQQCPLSARKQNSTRDTAIGVLVATHSTGGSNCKLQRHCRCHRSVSLPVDTSGHLNNIRMPIRLKNYLEESFMYGDRVRLLSSREHLFIFTIEILPGCLAEKITIAAVNQLTFKVLKETVFTLNDTVIDVALEETDTDIILAISQRMSGVWIYKFNGDVFQFHQFLETERVTSIHMISHKDTIFLAVASYGLEAMSTIWNMNDRSPSSGKFVVVKDVFTMGATDVIFTKFNDDLYVTFAQDPSGIDTFTEKWSQFRVPAQVLAYIPTLGTFEVMQQLDIDRVISLTNLVINGNPFMAVATFTGKVRVYRLIHGQGFRAEQTFKNLGVKKVIGYSIRNETYLTAVAEARANVFVARLRGFQKPNVKL